MFENCILRLFFYIIPLFLFSGTSWGHLPHKTKPVASHHYFIENKGQWPDNVLFRAEIQQGNVLVTKEGVTYQLISREPEISDNKPTKAGFNKSHGGFKKIKGHNLNVRLLNSNEGFEISKDEKSAINFQFLKGKNNANWVQDASAWEQLTLRNVYHGIDLKLYFLNGLLKYDFIVSSNTDPRQIELKYDGADSLKIEDGSLAIYTSLGKVYEKPPYSYQMIDHSKKEIGCRFKIEKNKIHFDLSKNYDPCRPIVIDPELIFSTFSGSRADNWGNTATFDSFGNLYSGGTVFADTSALPISPGAFETYGGGQTDILILKFSPDGTNLLAAYYLGGSESEIPISMIVNFKNELVVMGITSSIDFPVTTNAFDTTFNGGISTDAFYDFTGFPLEGYQPEISLLNGSDIFISVINSTTNSLVASTFIGGADNDGLVKGRTPPVKNYGDQLRGEVIVDSLNNVYIASHTYSDTLDKITASNAFNKGQLDAIVLKLDPLLQNVHWVYWHGGVQHESGFSLKQDKKGDLFLTGSTNSANSFANPITGQQNSYQGGIDGYIAKVSGLDGSLINGTFLGTSDFDQCYFVEVDLNDDVYVLGLTKGNYPVSANVYSNPKGGQFVHKLSNDLTTTAFSTRIGSGKLDINGIVRPDISPTAFMVNDCRKIFISGWGGVTNYPFEEWRYRDQNGIRRSFIYDQGYLGWDITGMPITKDALQKTTNGTGFYFMILQPEASSLGYATYYSGTGENKEHVDGGTSRFDKKGVIYQAVCAACGGQNDNFPITPNAWSVRNNSENCNNAALKFDLGKVVADFESFDSLTAIPSKYGCVPITFRIKNNSSGATNYKWEVGNGAISFKDDSIFIKFTQRGFQKITLIAFDTSICRLVDTARSTVNAGDVKVDFVPDIKQCGLSPVVPNIQLYTPWAKVKWEPTEGLSNPNIANPIVSYTGKDMVYHISVTDDTLCMKFDTLSVKIRDPNPKTKLQVWNRDRTKEQYSFCYPNDGFLTTRSTTHDYVEWKEVGNFFNIGVDSFYYTFPYPGKIKYEVSIYDSICDKSATDARIVTLSQQLPTYPIDTVLCPNTPITSKVIGDSGFTYRWKPEFLFSNPKSDVQTFLPKGNEQISIIVTDTIGCVDSSGYNIGILESIQAIFDKELKYCRRKADGIEIYSNMLNNYLWEPGGFTGNPLKVNASGTYFLTGLDVNNCPVKDTVKVIERCDPELYVPNAFSPNGDGQNDFFEVFGYDVSSFDIKIFDRWGEIIYHSTDFKFNWDGKYKSQTVPIGTYPFVISYKGLTFEGEAVSKTFSGDVTVVR